MMSSIMPAMMRVAVANLSAQMNCQKATSRMSRVISLELSEDSMTFTTNKPTEPKKSNKSRKEFVKARKLNLRKMI